MCDFGMTELTYATLAASAAAKYAATQQSNSAMQGVAAQEQGRQNAYNAQQKALLGQGINDNSLVNFNTKMNDGTQNRLVAMNNNVKNNAGPMNVGDALGRNGQAGQNQLVQSASNSRSSLGDAVTQNRANSMAALGGFSDAQLNTGINNARNLQAAGQIGSFQRGSSQVANLENEIAGRKGEGMNQLGDVLGAVSSVAGSAAATGINPWDSVATRMAKLAAMRAAAYGGSGTSNGPSIFDEGINAGVE